MSEDDDDYDRSFRDRFFTVEEVSLCDTNDMGVNSLEQKHGEETRILKRINIGSKVKACDKENDDITNDAKFPKLLSPNTYLYRRKVHTLNYSDTDLHLSTLPDEILLSIVQYLPYKSLCNLSEVSRRMYTVATDESLWQRIDLGGRKLSTNWLMFVLRRGIRVARLTSVEIASPLISPSLSIELINYQSTVVYMDLSEAIISIKGFPIIDLETLLSKCRNLKKLSLETCELSDGVCKEIGENRNLDTLNLCMCSGITATGIYSIVTNCLRLESFNVSWTSLNRNSLEELVSYLSPSIRRFNLSGQRIALRDKHVLELVSRCTEIIELDVSDCLDLSSSIINYILQYCKKLKSLSINRCYRINPTVLSELSTLPSFSKLNASRIISADTVTRDGVVLPNVKINKDYLSTIARPTVGIRKTSIWQIRCRE